MTDLNSPIYCVSCKKQIQTDAGFCPYCGFNQTRPQDQEMPPVPPMMPPPIEHTPSHGGQQQAQAPPPGQPTQVVYVQNKTNWWPLAIILTLLSPAGCLVIPLALAALGIGAVGVAALVQMIPACIGIIAGVVILRKQLFPPQYRMWIFYGLLIANIVWIMFVMKADK